MPGEDAGEWRQIGDVIRERLARILTYERLFVLEEFSTSELSTSQIWEAISETKRQLAALEDARTQERIVETLTNIVLAILPEELPKTDSEDGTPQLSAPLLSLLPYPAGAIEGAMGAILTQDPEKTVFPKLWQLLHVNCLTTSGINPERPSSKMPVLPTKATGKDSRSLALDYLSNTPLQEYFETLVPFSIPFSARFEHTHILGGSGHGKTQLLQSLLLRDLAQLQAGKGSVVVIDSQGDLIRNIVGLSALSDMADRVVLIDPNDIEHPPCLNLFDFGLDRLSHYDPVEREKLINGAIALYEYMFGALLGADLTQRQGVIFRYLARLLMVVPNATIHTLREFMESPEKTRPYLSKLDPTSKLFFETQFFASVYDDTRQQILTRLWGVISNSVLARMFSHTRNAVDLFSALNRGSLILINTAKDLLKQNGCEIFGRFFIALLVQAVQERAAIPENKRRATFVYIDKAQDYFDEGIENLLNQARKYKVGLILAHQNLGQFELKLQAAVMASTAIKIAGGLSARDAGTLSREMRCEPEFLLSMRKHAAATDFACFIRNVTAHPVALTVPFGQMEGQPRMSEAQLECLLAQNRQRVAEMMPETAGAAPRAVAAVPQSTPPEKIEIEAPELL
ncbi:MAG: ATP-binding protein [Acidobacteria bacterium]|nr:ATP-binding protein [Acidobacteriota bacterium]